MLTAGELSRIVHRIIPPKDQLSYKKASKLGTLHIISDEWL